MLFYVKNALFIIDFLYFYTRLHCELYFLLWNKKIENFIFCCEKNWNFNIFKRKWKKI